MEKGIIGNMKTAEKMLLVFPVSLIQLLYKLFLLSSHQVQQLYHIENQHLLGHSVMAVVLDTVIKEILCTSSMQGIQSHNY